MPGISAKDVQRLRQQSGAGMMECKKALTESDGDFDAALTWLRKKGIESAGKRSAREAGEGLVVIGGDAAAAAVVEVNCETDFVARSEPFQKFAAALADCTLHHQCADRADLIKASFDEKESVEEARIRMAASVGENIVISRATVKKADPARFEAIMSYVHGADGGSSGSIGVLVHCRGDGSAPDEAIGKHLAMHIAAMKPLAVSRAELPAETVEKEKEIIRAQSMASGKDAAILDKMVMGKMRKWYGNVVLTEQVFVIDQESKVADVLKKHQCEVLSFVRFALAKND